MTRKPAVAGLFYEKEFNKLNNQINECFLSEFGPKFLPKKERKSKIKAVIVPHAGYLYSGPCAAHAYKEIAESDFPETFILIGPNHTGIGYNSVLKQNMQTPFGIVNIDLELANNIIKNTNLTDDRSSHLKEHSLEVQLPFLQFASKNNLKNLKIVPIVLGHCNPKEIAKGIKKAIKGKNVTIIISSDFIHHGVNFDYYTFHEKISENVKKLDAEAFEFIKNKDIQGFINFIEKTGATICGLFPILVLMELVDYEKVKILSHYTSTDISKDDNICVDYISALFR